MSRLSDLARWLLPVWLIDRYQRLRYGRTWFDPRGRSSKVIFREIYRRNLWGGTAGQAYSGPGSDPVVAGPYIAAVAQFIRTHGVTSVVDVGCGDFRVGQALVAETGVRYTGADVVAELVARHQAAFGSDRVSFRCVDVTAERPPAADLCLVRQVFQHLSNDLVLAGLRNVAGYRWLIVTEHVWPNDRLAEANRDIHSGVETRVDVGSGLVFDRPPFNMLVAETLCEVPQPDGSVIRTVRLEPKPTA